MEQQGSTSIATPEKEMEESDNCSDEYFSCGEDSDPESSPCDSPWEDSDPESSSCDSPWDCLHSPDYYRRWDGRYVMEWNQIPSPYLSSSAFSSFSRSSSGNIENIPIKRDLSEELGQLLEAKNKVRIKLEHEVRKRLVDRDVIKEVHSFFKVVDKNIKLGNLLLREKVTRKLLPRSKQQRNRDASKEEEAIMKLLGETIPNLKSQVEVLFDAITQIRRPPSLLRAGDDHLIRAKHVIGEEDNMILRSIRKHVVDEQGDPIIGIRLGEERGILKEFHNKLAGEWRDTGDLFDIILYYGGELTVSEIQNDLAQRLNSSFISGETSAVERAKLILNSLSNYRLLIILDQIKNKNDRKIDYYTSPGSLNRDLYRLEYAELVLHLWNVGVPRPSRSNKCKIVMDSDSNKVCRSMGVTSWLDRGVCILDNFMESLLPLQSTPGSGNHGVQFETGLCELLGEAPKLLEKEPNVLKLEAPVKICGDMRGQLEDLVRLFDLAGSPPSARYIFLGNYVDWEEGERNLETVCLLLLYKVRYPDRIFLLRGNQESVGDPALYVQCKNRFTPLWITLERCFNRLPIAAVVGSKILCVHGGLSPELTTLDEIDAIERKIEIPDYGPLRDLLCPTPGDAGSCGSSEDWESSSSTFGADVAPVEFLEKNNLDLLCRGRPIVENGYEFSAEKRMVTLCSAPNHSQQFGNSGAIMSVEETLAYSFEMLNHSEEEEPPLLFTFT